MNPMNLKKPENVLVSFKRSFKRSDFEFKLADWGTAGMNEAFFGGTPGYASKQLFNFAPKDYFSVGRSALNLIVKKTGSVDKSFIFGKFLFDFCQRNYFIERKKDRLILCYFPIENKELLGSYR